MSSNLENHKDVAKLKVFATHMVDIAKNLHASFPDASSVEFDFQPFGETLFNTELFEGWGRIDVSAFDLNDVLCMYGRKRDKVLQDCIWLALLDSELLVELQSPKQVFYKFASKELQYALTGSTLKISSQDWISQTNLITKQLAEQYDHVAARINNTHDDELRTLGKKALAQELKSLSLMPDETLRETFKLA